MTDTGGSDAGVRDDADVGLVLRLYVSADGPLNDLARTRLDRLSGRLGVGCVVEVVDVDEDPAAAERDQVLATPTLQRVHPPPVLRVVGDLTDLEAALDGLGLRVWQLDHTDGHG